MRTRVRHGALCARAIAGALLLVIATQHAPPAVSAINPTGRRLELQVPVALNGQTAGSLMLAIEADDALSLDGPGFAALLVERLGSDALEAVAGATVDGRLTPDALTAAGLPTEFDGAALSLIVTVPVSALKRQRFSLGSSRAESPGAREPARFSAFANLGLAALHDRREGVGSALQAETEFRLEVDGLVRLNGPVIAYEALQSVDREGNAVAARRLTALLLDVPSRELRITAGDQTYLGRGLQRSVPLLGVGIGRDFALRDGDGVRVTGRRSIELARASQVEVFVGERLLDTFDLPAGSFDFEDIPLAAGANDVVLLVRDDTGGVERIEFTELFDNGLLPPGRYDYGMGLGVRSVLGEGEPEYLDDAPVASGYVRRGFGGGSTYGANLEATDTVWRLGAEWLRATRLGPVELLAAVSGGDGTGYALGAEFSTLQRVGSSLGPGRLDVRVVARSAEFVAAGDELASGTLALTPTADGSTDANGTDLALALGYGAGLESGIAFGVGSTLVRRAGDAELATSLAVSGRWSALPRLGWAVRLRYASRDREGDERSLQAGLSWRIDRVSRVSFDHSTLESATRIDYGRDDGSGSVGAYGIGLSVTGVPGRRTELDARLARTFNRFDALAAWRGSRTDVVDDDFDIAGTGGIDTADDVGTGDRAEDAGSAVVRLDTAVGIAGGSIGIGRRIDDGFAIVSAHPTLEKRPVLIDAREDRHEARTGVLGPALVRSPSPYRPGRIRYDVNDLPLGYDIGSGSFDVRAPFGAGYSLQVGSAARVTVVGTLLDGEGGAPLGLATGNALPADGVDLAPVRFFSNRSGKFAIPGLLPGTYEIVLDTTPERRVTLVVPEDADSLFRVPELVIP